LLFAGYLADEDAAGVPVPRLAAEIPSLAARTWRVLGDDRMETTHRLRPSLKTPLFSSGRTNLSVPETDLLKLRGKVYAEGGENGLRTHKGEDHAFVVLQGQVTFHDEADAVTVVNKYEGILLPRGVFYWFQSTGDENLVLLRVGAGREREGEFRVDPNGRPRTREEDKHIDGTDPGKFFGA
jgi:quercetin dioxygenase-like cupin family protein